MGVRPDPEELWKKSIHAMCRDQNGVTAEEHASTIEAAIILDRYHPWELPW